MTAPVIALFRPADATVLAGMIEDLARRPGRGKRELRKAARLLACPPSSDLECALDAVREAAYYRDGLTLGSIDWTERYDEEDLTGFGDNQTVAIEMATGQAADEIDRLINAHGGNHER